MSFSYSVSSIIQAPCESEKIKKGFFYLFFFSLCVGPSVCSHHQSAALASWSHDVAVIYSRGASQTSRRKRVGLSTIKQRLTWIQFGAAGGARPPRRCLLACHSACFKVSPPEGDPSPQAPLKPEPATEKTPRTRREPVLSVQSAESWNSRFAATAKQDGASLTGPRDTDGCIDIPAKVTEGHTLDGSELWAKIRTAPYMKHPLMAGCGIGQKMWKKYSPKVVFCHFRWFFPHWWVFESSFLLWLWF